MTSRPVSGDKGFCDDSSRVIKSVTMGEWVKNCPSKLGDVIYGLLLSSYFETLERAFSPKGLREHRLFQWRPLMCKDTIM